MTDDELYDNMVREEQSGQLAQSAIISHNVDPDKYAANRNEVRSLGLPVSVAKPAKKPTSVNNMTNTVNNFNSLLERSPRTATFLITPEYAKLTHDDTENLSAWEDFFKPVIHTAASMVQMPISGLSATAKLITSKGDLSAANQVLEENQRILDETYLATDKSREVSGFISKAMLPFQMAGRGWAGLAELPTGGLSGAERVVGGEDPGSNIMVPVMGTIGEASAMFGLGEGLKVAKARAEIISKALEKSKVIKVNKRDPEVAREFFKTASQDAAPVKMPVEKFDEILAETRKTPDEVLDNPEQYYDAKFKGEDVEIPVSDLAAMADNIKPEHVNEMKVGEFPSASEMEMRIEDAKAKEAQDGLQGTKETGAEAGRGQEVSFPQLYHGGAKGLTKLSVDKAGLNAWPEERAIWLTADKGEAEFFAGDKGQVYQIQFQPQNPLVVEYNDWFQSGTTRNIKKQMWIDRAREAGYDSVVFKDTTAFNDIRPPKDEIAVLQDIPIPSPEAKLQPQGEFGSRGGEGATGGNLQESQLAIRAEADAIEKKLVENLGDLAEYRTMNMKDQAARAQSILDADYEAAKRMAMGDELPPEGIREATMYEAVKIRALKEGDVDTLYKLATESTVPTRLSEYGQAIKAADSALMNDPIRDAQDIAKERLANARKRGENPAAVTKISELTKQLDEAEKKLAVYEEEFAKKKAQKKIDEIVKVESKKQARIRTKAELDTEFTELTIKLNSILNPNRMNVGIPIDTIPVLVDMAKNRIKAGVVSVEGVVDAVYQQVKDVLDVTKKELRDVLVSELQDIAAQEDVAKLKAAKSRLKTETAKLKGKIESGDLVYPVRKKIKLDEEGQRLKSERDRIKEAYKTAVDATGTIGKEEVANLVELSQAMQNAKDAMEQGGNRLQYGAAKVTYEKYVDELRRYDAPLKTIIKNRAAEFKTTAATNPAKAGYELGKDAINTVTNNSIAMVATLDDSFMGRQGLKTLMTHPSVWWPAAKESFVDFAKTIGGENAHDALLADLYSRPNFLDGSYHRAKILAKNEEQYPANLPERIPGIGRVFRASEFAFTGSALRMRTGLFDLLSKQAKENGVNLANKAEIESLGKLINSLTARGQWGQRGEGVIVRVILWAPKMLKANIDVLTMHNFGAGLESSFARKQAALNLVKIVAETATLMMIADALMPGSVEYDPRSTDFGKIKVNDTRFDITGGAASIVVLASRIATRSSKSTQTGLVTEYGLEYGKPTPFDALVDFLVNKTSPPTRVVVDWLKGEDRQKDEFTLTGSLYSAFTPISIQNFINLKDDASADRVAGAIVDMIGVNASTYGDEGNRKRDIVNRIRKGKDLTPEQQDLYDSLTDREQANIEKASSMTAQQYAFSTLAPDAMVYAWARLTDAERDELRDIYDAKINKYILGHDLDGEELDNLLTNMEKAENRQ